MYAGFVDTNAGSLPRFREPPSLREARRTIHPRRPGVSAFVRSLRSFLRAPLLAVLLGLLAGLAERAHAGEKTAGAAIERGRYIVHHVAMCIYCHSPKDDSGEPIESQLLMGAPIPLRSPFPDREWASEAPKIAGLPGGYEKEDLVRLLMTGKTKSGRPPSRPMPPFRMNRADASAVAAYVASLEPAPAAAPVP